MIFVKVSGYQNQMRSPFEARVVWDHPYITSVFFRLFGPNPLHPNVSIINTVLKVNKNGHFLNPPTNPVHMLT
jgi:hypothetical protein